MSNSILFSYLTRTNIELKIQPAHTGKKRMGKGKEDESS